MAGEDWLSSFLKRHQNLARRKLEATNLALLILIQLMSSKIFFHY